MPTVCFDMADIIGFYHARKPNKLSIKFYSLIKFSIDLIKLIVKDIIEMGLPGRKRYDVQPQVVLTKLTGDIRIDPGS